MLTDQRTVGGVLAGGAASPRQEVETEEADTSERRRVRSDSDPGRAQTFIHGFDLLDMAGAGF
ncbi:MAG TPA: hypothetical protein VGL92_16615 [Acidimicrobiia bacterium]|jgi:hypothetical protein